MNENIIESIAAKYTPEDAASRAQVRQAIREALQHSASIVPEGYQLVPLRPTQEMCQQGQWKAKEWPGFPLRISAIYQAMLAAAPAPNGDKDV